MPAKTGIPAMQFPDGGLRRHDSAAAEWRP
jgi:hypothetical protein